MEEPRTEEAAAAAAAAAAAVACGHSRGYQHGSGSVCAVYRAKIGDVLRHVTITWSRDAGSHTLSVAVDKRHDEVTLCKIDLRPWTFWGKFKGSKSVDVDDSRVEVFWNLRSAKFPEGVEPSEGYFVAVVADAEMVLLVGDRKRKAYKKTRARPPLEDAELMLRKEIVLGKKVFNARTTFDDGKEHDVAVVHAVPAGHHKDPEMWIRIDGAELIHVNNLRWNFRGNELVRVGKVPVQVMWDVHDWVYRAGQAAGIAMFIFKTGLPKVVAPVVEGDGGRGESGASNAAVNGEGSSSSRGDGGGGEDGAHGFCFFLYARKKDHHHHHQQQHHHHHQQQQQ